MKVTHRMIARATGFTQSTVSKALNSTGRVSEKTTEIIRRAAKEMGYYSQERKNHNRRESHLFPQIAVLVPEISSWYYANLVEMLQAQIERLGGSLCVFVTGFVPGKALLQLETLKAQNTFDGIVVLDYPEKAMNADVPLIMVTGDTSYVPTDKQYLIRYENRIERLVSHLTELGHREIGFLGETNTTDKLTAFCDVMRQHRLPLNMDFIYTSQYRFERIGHDGVAALARRGTMPTALVCAYDEVAFGAIEELEKLGCDVPGRVSVVGINNIEYCVHFKPPLTTTQLNPALLRDAFTEIVQKAIIEEAACAHRFDIPSELIVRKSTAPCPA